MRACACACACVCTRDTVPDVVAEDGAWIGELRELGFGPGVAVGIGIAVGMVGLMAIGGAFFVAYRWTTRSAEDTPSKPVEDPSMDQPVIGCIPVTAQTGFPTPEPFGGGFGGSGGFGGGSSSISAPATGGFGSDAVWGSSGTYGGMSGGQPSGPVIQPTSGETAV